MLKIHQLFLRTYLAIFVAILITVTLSTYFWAKNLYLNQVEKNLIQNIDILSVILEDTKDINSIKDIIKDLSKKLNLRISIINENGEVVAESHKNIEDIKNGDTIIIRSHGITKNEFDKINATGAKVVDATCINVKKIHKIDS